MDNRNDQNYSSFLATIENNSNKEIESLNNICKDAEEFLSKSNDMLLRLVEVCKTAIAAQEKHLIMSEHAKQSLMETVQNNSSFSNVFQNQHKYYEHSLSIKKADLMFKKMTSICNTVRETIGEIDNQASEIEQQIFSPEL